MASSDSSSATSTGVVIRFYDNKGYGFIKPDTSVSDDEDLFVHHTEIQCDGYRTLEEGQKVKFSVSVKNDKKQAVNVTGLDGSNLDNHHHRRSIRRRDDVSNGRRSGFRGSGGNGSNGVECFNCGGVGHIARDCSSDVVVRSVTGRCYSCSGFGHLARDCTRGTNVVVSGGGRGGNGGRGCYNCGEEGHMARDCANGSVDNSRGSRGGCFNCGEVGHMAKECGSDGGGRGVRGRNDGGFGGGGCYNCGKEGHIARDCDAKINNRGGGNKSGGGSGGCYNCGETGHFARECPSAS